MDSPTDRKKKINRILLIEIIIITIFGIWSLVAPYASEGLELAGLAVAFLLLLRLLVLTIVSSLVGGVVGFIWLRDNIKGKLILGFQLIFLGFLVNLFSFFIILVILAGVKKIILFLSSSTNVPVKF